MSPDSTTLKRCTKCGELKPATREYFSARGSANLRRTCKKCESDYRAANRERYSANNKAWREANRERKAASNKTWYEANRNANREHKAAVVKAWREANHERFMATKKAWREANREHIAETRKAYRAANRDWLTEYGKLYYEANREYYSERKKAWLKANPDKSRMQDQKRRARKAMAGGECTVDDLTAIRAAQTDKRGRLICWRCGKPITDTPHLDHWIPLSKGGTNDPGNLRYMHAKCNIGKGNKLPTEIGRLI